MLGTTVTHPSATRGASLQNETRQAGVGGLPGRPGSWQSRATAIFASKEALMVEVSKGIKGRWRERLPLGAGIMPAFTSKLLPVLGGPLPPWGGGPGQLWGLGRRLLTSHDDLETGQMAALTQGACPEDQAPPSGAHPRRQDPCGDGDFMEAGQVAPRLPKCRGKLLQEAFPVTQVTLGMTRGALPLSPRDTQPLDHVGGPWRSHCRGAPNMEPGLLGGRACHFPCPLPSLLFSQFFIYKMETKRTVISQT